jgi:cell division protein FtsB
MSGFVYRRIIAVLVGLVGVLGIGLYTVQQKYTEVIQAQQEQIRVLKAKP